MANMVGIEGDLDVDLATEIGARIHQLMWRKRITQTQLGEAIGVTQGTAGKKVRGQVAVTIVELMKIARLLEVEPGDLLPSVEEVWLPRLDSNQQPSGYRPMELLHCQPEPAGDTWAEVIDIAVIRERKAAS